MTDNITALRPKPKDATNAQHQAQYHKKRNNGAAHQCTATRPVTVPAISAAPVTIAPPVERDRGVTACTLLAALALATVSGGFSITGMTSIFTGALYPVIGMGVALEVGKLSAVAWLGHRHRAASWALKAALTALVLILMGLNGCKARMLQIM
jgi:hypothetical protein